MTRLFNFSAGPAVLPDVVLEQVKAELLDWNGQGASVMEISHRSQAFEEMAATCEQDLRTLLAIPSNYKVLFLQGGGYGQFSGVPLNILGTHASIDLLETGVWSQKARQSAQALTRVNLVGSSQDRNYTYIPTYTADDIDQTSAYLYYCANETVHGVEFQTVPESGGLPLVCDMSSNILTCPIDVSRYGVIFAGAQKNIGPAGIVIVIVRDDLLDRAHPYTPDILNYALQAQQGSMLNTPPTFSWYVISLVFKWLKKMGGVKAMQQHNAEKSALLYRAIDQSQLYRNPVNVDCRSRINVPFILQDEGLNQTFLNQAQAAGLTNLKGHRSVGGMRASIYNAMSLEGVQKLCDFMQDFEKNA